MALKILDPPNLINSHYYHYAVSFVVYFCDIKIDIHYNHSLVFDIASFRNL